MAHLEISQRAKKDLGKIRNQDDRARVTEGLRELAAEPPPANLDLKALTGQAPWLRLRVGEHRIILRPLAEAEQSRLVMRRGTLSGSPAYVVARIVNRRDLDRAIRTLEVPEDVG